MLKYSVIFVFLGLVGKSLSAPGKSTSLGNVPRLIILCIDWSQAARGKRGESDDIVIPTCQVPSKISADDSIVKTIVDFHNAKRREESAKNMAELVSINYFSLSVCDVTVITHTIACVQSCCKVLTLILYLDQFGIILIVLSRFGTKLWRIWRRSGQSNVHGRME